MTMINNASNGDVEPLIVINELVPASDVAPESMRLLRNRSDHVADQPSLLETRTEELNQLGRRIVNELLEPRLVAGEEEATNAHDAPVNGRQESEPESQPNLLDIIDGILNGGGEDASGDISSLLLSRYDDATSQANLGALGNIGAALALGSSLSGVAGMFFSGIGAAGAAAIAQLLPGEDAGRSALDGFRFAFGVATHEEELEFSAEDFVDATTVVAGNITDLLPTEAADDFVSAAIGHLLERHLADQPPATDDRPRALLLIDSADRADQLFDYLGEENIGALTSPAEAFGDDDVRLSVYRLAAVEHADTDPGGAEFNAGLLIGSADAFAASDAHRELLSEVLVTHLEPIRYRSEGEPALFGSPNGVELSAETLSAAVSVIAGSPAALGLLYSGLFAGHVDDQYRVDQESHAVTADRETRSAGEMAAKYIDAAGEMIAAELVREQLTAQHIVGEINRMLGLTAVAPTAASGVELAVTQTLDASADRRHAAAARTALQPGSFETNPVPGAREADRSPAGAAGV